MLFKRGFQISFFKHKLNLLDTSVESRRRLETTIVVKKLKEVSRGEEERKESSKGEESRGGRSHIIEHRREDICREEGRSR